ncbi:MAG: rhomboid family intramembrane serine protease [Rhodococcus sp.]|uniref:rhomboid family intramembrane serine protease n=1 Tax=Rhodococcus TaxID=1827 RepID=UPI0016BAC8E4|nr:rhomboid family intramembrane serine protease [Rhodococcus sp. (in: high G+C Gram-positive bacteria)]NLV79031.1 rhomboid family intramembrane serine protease [Rhodococcus sp. (in: high G+C Gram-positive bacteria)]
MNNPGWGASAEGGGLPPQPRCVRHPDRPTLLSCTRCGRPFCTECLQPASVGHQCVDCVAQGHRSVPTARTVAGAPVRTDRPTPIVTYVLLALNVLVFAITAMQSGSVLNNERSSQLFVDWGLYPPYIVYGGEYVRLLGSGFLHFGLMHLAVNMFALWIIGRDTEIVLGRLRYLGVYLVSILGGSTAVMFLQTQALTAGASGAVFGLLGAQTVILLRLRRSPTPVLVVIALNVFISLTIPGISLAGHLGGLAAGAAATAAFLYGPQLLGAGRDRDRIVRTGWVAFGVVTAVTLALVTLSVLQPSV